MLLNPVDKINNKEITEYLLEDEQFIREELKLNMKNSNIKFKVFINLFKEDQKYLQQQLINLKNSIDDLFKKFKKILLN